MEFLWSVGGKGIVSEMFYKPHKRNLGKSYIMYIERQFFFLPKDFFWNNFLRVIFGSD